MGDPVDLPELRRQAERDAQGYNAGAAYWPAKCLALLDRIDAQAAVIARLQAGWGTKGRAWWRHLSPEREDTWPEEEPMSEAEQAVFYPGAVAGEPENEGTT